MNKEYFKKWNVEHRAYKREWMQRRRAALPTKELKIYQNKPELNTRERYPICHAPRPKSYKQYLREWKAKQPKWDREAVRERMMREIEENKLSTGYQQLGGHCFISKSK